MTWIPQQVLLTVLKNLVQRDAGGSYALARVVDAVAEINRPQVGTAGLLGKPFSAATTAPCWGWCRVSSAIRSAA